MAAEEARQGGQSAGGCTAWVGDAAHRSQASWGPARWLKQVSGLGQAPLGRPAGTSCTSQYFCLRFHVPLSQALPRGAPTATCALGPGQDRHRPAGATAPPVSGPGAAGPLTADSLLHSGGSAGPIPNSAHCSVLGRAASCGRGSCSGRSLRGAHWPQVQCFLIVHTRGLRHSGTCCVHVRGRDA